MDKNSSENDIYYGREDYEEDDDIYLPFGIQNQHKDYKEKSNFAQLTGFNTATASNFNIKKKKKSKKKSKESEIKSATNVSIVLPTDNDFTEVLRSSNSYKENESDNNMTSQDSINKTQVNISTLQAKSMPEPVSLYNIAPIQLPVHPQSFVNFPQQRTYQPIMHPMMQQNVLNNLASQFMFFNNINQSRNAIQPQFCQIPNSSYSLTTTYTHRLNIIDNLFRFIMQLLRSPEQPPIQQIEMLKQMLDSLIVVKPPEISVAK